MNPSIVIKNSKSFPCYVVSSGKGIRKIMITIKKRETIETTTKLIRCVIFFSPRRSETRENAIEPKIAPGKPKITIIQLVAKGEMLYGGL